MRGLSTSRIEVQSLLLLAATYVLGGPTQTSDFLVAPPADALTRIPSSPPVGQLE